MNAGICHVFAPEELTERGTGAPEDNLIVKNPIFGQNIKDILVKSRKEEGGRRKEISFKQLYRSFVKIFDNRFPVVVMDKFGKIDLAHHGG